MAAKFHSFFLGGKGKRTATVLRADFKAALAKTTADAAAASEGEL